MNSNIIFHKPIFRVNEENPLTNNELVVVLVGITVRKLSSSSMILFHTFLPPIVDIVKNM
jgi:hypothetical protein